VFRVVIRRWNLRTPGRELENDTEATEATESTESPKAA
jgi:phosphotransferase system  glucose/maltose/N-acetylglucosamine-specific IIC component